MEAIMAHSGIFSQTGHAGFQVDFPRSSDFQKKHKEVYFSGYQPKPIVLQLESLRHFFPEIINTIEVSQVVELAEKKELPDYVEGAFVKPAWQSIAPSYCEAVQVVHDLIARHLSLPFSNYRKLELDQGHVRQSVASVQALEKLKNKQVGNILVFHAQFGAFYRNYSVSQVREDLSQNEFELDSFSVGIMFLTHLERLRHSNDLWIDCPGDEVLIKGVWENASCYRFSEGGIRYDANDVSVADSRYGSATGFIVD